MESKLQMIFPGTLILCTKIEISFKRTVRAGPGQSPWPCAQLIRFQPLLCPSLRPTWEGSGKNELHHVHWVTGIHEKVRDSQQLPPSSLWVVRIGVQWHELFGDLKHSLCLFTRSCEPLIEFAAAAPGSRRAPVP